MSKKSDTLKSEKISCKTVITGHVNADFDALAAMVAASKLYDDCVLVYPGSQEQNLRKFYIESITYLYNFKSLKDIDIDGVETLVTVDTRQANRVPQVAPLLERKDVEIHCYDHHPDSDDDLDASFQIVDTTWGSTTAIICNLLEQRGIKLNGEEATLLGLGIYEDTGSFQFNSASEHDFRAAAYLRSQGMDVTAISDLISREMTAEQIALLGRLIDSTSVHEIHGVEVAFSELTTDEFVGDFAFIVRKLIDVQQFNIIFVIARMDDRVHVIARSRSKNVKVGEICKSLGGGGHDFAASATVKDGTVEDVKNGIYNSLLGHVAPRFSLEKLMSRPPVVIEDTSTMHDAMELMGRYSLKGVPVVKNGTMECVGVLEHHVADKAVSHGLDDVPVEEYMFRDVRIVSSRCGLQEVMESILGDRQRMLPVVEDGKILGVVTRTDLIHHLVEEPSRIPENLGKRNQRARNIRRQMESRLPSEIIKILRTAGQLGADHGFDVFTVGGFVRDIILEKPNLDIDLVVEDGGIRFAEILANHFGGRFKAHPKFKTAVVILPTGMKIDVATARLEYYAYPAALPTVELSSIKMDLFRRDFTINALALNLSPDNFGDLVDFFNAQKDLKGGVVRVLHSLSFVEDPTRILRAIKFEIRFGFSIGKQTLRLIKNAVKLNLFEKLSGARIRTELQTIANEKNSVACWERMYSFRLLQAIDPILALNNKKLAVLSEIDKIQNWYQLLYIEPEVDAWTLHFLGLTVGVNKKHVAQISERLGFSHKERVAFLRMRDNISNALRRIKRWVIHEDRGLSDLHKMLEPLGLEGVLFVMARAESEEARMHISQYLQHGRFFELDINGHDLRKMGVPRGPLFGAILQKVKADALDGKVNGREEQLARAKVLMTSLQLPESKKSGKQMPSEGKTPPFTEKNAKKDASSG
ncbi:MAG: CBS domain-containing protein [Desulfovibrio sp.]